MKHYEALMKYHEGEIISSMIGARFPDAIVKKIDTLVDSKDYLSRAEVVRDFVRGGFERRENKKEEALI